jgi:hypothetical protein
VTLKIPDGTQHTRIIDIVDGPLECLQLCHVASDWVHNPRVTVPICSPISRSSDGGLNDTATSASQALSLRNGTPSRRLVGRRRSRSE